MGILAIMHFFDMSVTSKGSVEMHNMAFMFLLRVSYPQRGSPVMLGRLHEVLKGCSRKVS